MVRYAPLQAQIEVNQHRVKQVNVVIMYHAVTGDKIIYSSTIAFALRVLSKGDYKMCRNCFRIKYVRTITSFLFLSLSNASGAVHI